MVEAQNCVAGKIVTHIWDTKIVYGIRAWKIIKVLYVFRYNEK
jgi:hypothetical protein